jgi:flagella basal body P-ring formation protein FlgA
MQYNFGYSSITYRHSPSRLAELMLMIIAALLLLSAPAYAQDYSLNLQDLEALIAESLVSEGAGEEPEVSITGRMQPVLARGHAPLQAGIDYLDYDARSLSWNAVVSLFEDGELLKTLELNGRYAPTAQVPVLSRRLHNSDVIGEEDIVWQHFPEHRLRKDTILSAEQLIGKSPRRVISENRPVRIADVEAPSIVDKGDLIRISFQTPFMEIRTVGEAMEEGASGQRIRIRNSESGIVVQAVITGPGEAEVKQLMQISDAR